MTTEFHLDQKLDGQGNPEEFIRDAKLILPRGTTDHLNEDGLPPVGCQVYPGMLLIAKFGATASYRREVLPTYIEQRTESEEVLLRRYKHMHYDGSFYVPKGIFGVVKEAFFEPHGKYIRAVVRVDISEEKPETQTKRKRKPSAAFMKPVQPDEKLAAIIGGEPLLRTEVVRKLWDYIHSHNLQDPTNKTRINADEKLKNVFEGRKQVTMFEMAKLVSKHVK